MKNNMVTVVGLLKSPFELKNKRNGKEYFCSEITTERSSGVVDEIPILVPGGLIDPKIKWEKEFILINGEFRSKNEDGHVKLFVFAREMKAIIGCDFENKICLDGFVCKKPEYRTTPFGREITDLLLAVNGEYRGTSYLPCICWGQNAKIAASLSVGTHVKVAGRIQSRKYEKEICEGEYETRTAYEVSIWRLEVIGSEKRKDQVADAE